MDIYVGNWSGGMLTHTNVCVCVYTHWYMHCTPVLHTQTTTIITQITTQITTQTTTQITSPPQGAFRKITTESDQLKRQAAHALKQRITTHPEEAADCLQLMQQLGEPLDHLRDDFITGVQTRLDGLLQVAGQVLMARAVAQGLLPEGSVVEKVPAEVAGVFEGEGQGEGNLPGVCCGWGWGLGVILPCIIHTQTNTLSCIIVHTYTYNHTHTMQSRTHNHTHIQNHTHAHKKPHPVSQRHQFPLSS